MITQTDLASCIVIICLLVFYPTFRNKGSWNVRTLHRAYSLDVLTQDFQLYNLDIFGFQDTRWTDKACAIKIRPLPCTNAMGEHGTCMFVWDCINRDGKQLGTCIDGFLVGTCCSHNDEENTVPGAGNLHPTAASFSSTLSSQPPKHEVTKKPAASSNVYVTSVTLPPFSITSAPLKMKPSGGENRPSASMTTINGIVKPVPPLPTPAALTSSESEKPRDSPSINNVTSAPQVVKPVDYSECGIASPQPKMKVVGGTNSAFGDWPWQVSVRRTSFFGFASTHRCGGAILNANWIATAGHCVDDLLKSQIRIRVGEYDFSTSQEPYPYQERGVQQKVVHPRYNFFTYEYDLALVKVDTPLVLQPHVKPLCLPPGNDTLIGRNATITGWGRLSEGGSLPTMLQQVQVPIISNDKCKIMFLSAGRQESIPDIFMCAGYESGGRDSCQGDSGGPLQVKGDDGRWFLAGIISWGIGCAEPNMPGVCTRISKFKDWILNYVK